MGSLARASAPLRCHPGRHSARRERGRTPASSRNEEPITVSLIATTNAPGLGYDDVVKTTVLLADIADFAAVNEVYARYFTGETLPARAAFGVAALPLGAGVEIEAIAARS